MNCACIWDKEKQKVITECGAHNELIRNWNNYILNQLREERVRILTEAGKKSIALITLPAKEYAQESIEAGILIGEAQALGRVIDMLSH